MRSLLVTALAATALLAAPTASAPLAAQPSPQAHVRIVDFAYKARALRVHVGTRVAWRNVDKTNHTVTFRGGRGPTSIDNLRPGDQAARTFRTPGRFTYVCDFHPFMRGSVLVTR